jgi:hypothetical protein
VANIAVLPNNVGSAPVTQPNPLHSQTKRERLDDGRMALTS